MGFDDFPAQLRKYLPYKFFEEKSMEVASNRYVNIAVNVLVSDESQNVNLDGNRAVMDIIDICLSMLFHRYLTSLISSILLLFNRRSSHLYGMILIAAKPLSTDDELYVDYRLNPSGQLPSW